MKRNLEGDLFQGNRVKGDSGTDQYLVGMSVLETLPHGRARAATQFQLSDLVQV